MRYYTSYFANYHNIPDNYDCYSIARYSPDFFKNQPIGVHRYVAEILAPSECLLRKIKNNEISQEEYSKQYVIELADNIKAKGYNSFFDYFSMIDKYYNESPYINFDGVVFLCYEKPDEFCHRHILSNVMNQVGFRCEEWQNKKKQLTNNALF